MRLPGLPWAGFNLLRLVGVVFIIWAFVAQFIALANNLSANSRSSVSTTSLTTSESSSSSSSDGQLVTASSTIDSQWGASPSSPSSTTSLALATSGSIITKGQGISPANAIAEDGKSGGQMIKRAKETDDGNETSANWGMSSIPDQPGGITFTIISRLMMAIVLGLLLCGQSGWPEMFLYKYVPWLGPQSTPIWLGLVEVVVAIENLRVYAKSVVLISAWGLFAVGLFNLLIGAVLLYLGRRLPKSPPAPLYFNMSQRPLFWTSLPPCYRQLCENAYEIGLDEDEEDEEKSIKSNHHSTTHNLTLAPAAPLMGRPKAPHQDVTRGGYPTFSGGGPADPGRQVPTGFLERAKDGRLLKFVNENGQEVSPQVQTNPRPEELGAERGHPRRIEPSGSGGDRKEVRVIQNRLPPRTYSKGRTPAALNLDGTEKAMASRNAPDQAAPKPPHVRPIPRHVQQARDEMTNSLSRVNSKRQSTLSSVSTISATKDLGPQFPLPPTRSFSADSISSLGSPKPAVTQPSGSATTARMHSKRGKGPPPRELDLPKPKERGKSRPESTVLTPKSPAMSVREPPLTAPPLSPTHSQSGPSIPRPLPQHKRSATLQAHLSGPPGNLPLRSSMAPSALTRSESSRSAKGTRLAHGVRFMDKVEERSPSPPCTGQTGTTTATTVTTEGYSDDDEITAELRSPARRGVRVPGTNFQLPALSWPGLGSARRDSFDHDSTRGSVLSDSSLEDLNTSSSDDDSLPYRKETSAKPKDAQDRKRANPSASKRPKTVAILGGSYLDGRKETRERRPSSMSFDLRSSLG
ncbi:hypothetical protein L198_01010 [Cryptococcus wingfieldii CBS 7118]|uniref:Uncharacterized protein n=1 Tax=Cryptococcus wingfieldii CBS 7118 TaxID=1295528 RepID=A0A1E3K328_9TREE|nr:hypothetical protein L198_01010 [Cryptococcus wingfieldii CBS 7118]ODO07431.1 hypothetical protein L198_01010 [Cryptococcus wingfieldii CBS 7118]